MKKQVWMCALAVLIGYGVFAGMPAYAEDGKFVAVEVGGAKFWLGGGDVDMRSPDRTQGPVTIKLVNKMDADHGFAIDALKVKQVVKPGEEVTITVSSADVPGEARVLKYYCHLHTAHVGGTIVIFK